MIAMAERFFGDLNVLQPTRLRNFGALLNANVACTADLHRTCSNKPKKVDKTSVWMYHITNTLKE